MHTFGELWRDVIMTGLCTACGTCAGVCPTGVIEFDRKIEHPKLVGKCKPSCGVCYDVCPGKDVPLPNLDKMLFGRERDVSEEIAGITRSYLKGYALNPQIRDAGASGGCASALLVYALENDIIECAVVAGMSNEQPWRAESKIAKTVSEIIAASRSKYVVFPHNVVLHEIMQEGYNKVGFVGLPCHVHAIRKIQLLKKPKKLANKIELVLGILCGCNASLKATEHMIKEGAGITSLDEVITVGYRGGKDRLSFEVVTKNYGAIELSEKLQRKFLHAFWRDRCLMCYDWAAELADVSLGDLFDSKGIRKTPGWSTMAVRTNEGKKLINDAEKKGYIKTFPIEETEFLTNIGFEQKKHGAIYRLVERQKFGWPTPNYGYQIKMSKTTNPKCV